MRPSARAALRNIILAQTGQDPRACVNCDSCEGLRSDKMDLSFGQILRAAARDDERALTNRSIWNPHVPSDGTSFCQAELDLGPILEVLRREAERRGIRPPDGWRASAA